MDVASFLSRYPPFDALSADELTTVVKATQIEHFAAGTVILEQSGEPARSLYVVRKGAVELLVEGRVYDELRDGEVFGQFSLLADERPTATVRALEDTLCYLIGAGVADALLGTSTGRMFVLGTMRQRLAAVTDVAEPPGPQLRPLSGLVRRSPVTADPGMSVAQAAQRMAGAHVSCLLVPMRDGWGIVTDRDLRARVLAAHRSPETPVEEIATFPLKVLPDSALVGEVMFAMLAEGVHHIPVTRPDGSIAGVVTATDVMDIGRDTPFSIRSAIERARTRDEVVSAGQDLPHVVLALVDASSEPVGVGRVVALVIDAMTTRLLALAIEELGDPPVPWAWLALGSAARHEQALSTDQDHALVYDPGDRAAEDIDPSFAAIAEFVTAGLEDAGIPRCPGDAMATHPVMRRSVQGWIEAMRGWMRDPGPTGSVLSSIVYDFRRVTGPLDPTPELDTTIRDARADVWFQRHLGQRALARRPPAGFIRDLVVEGKGEHVGRLDVKHGGITTIGSIARLEAVKAGTPAKETLDRLAAAASAGKMEQRLADELSEAFRFLWEVRLRHQAAQVRSGEPPDDFVDPSTLGPVARRGLKEAFTVISRAQRGIATELDLRMP